MFVSKTNILLVKILVDGKLGTQLLDSHTFDGISTCHTWNGLQFILKIFLFGYLLATLFQLLLPLRGFLGIQLLVDIAFCMVVLLLSG